MRNTKTQTYQHNLPGKDKTLKKRRKRQYPCDMREQSYRTWLQQTKQKYIRKRRRESWGRASQNYHVKFSCTRILAHFLKQQHHARGYFYPLHRARARISGGYPRLRRIQEAKSRAIWSTDCSQRLGKISRARRGFVFMVSRSMRECASMAYVPKHFLTFLVKDAGIPARASFFRPRCAVEGKENETRSRTVEERRIERAFPVGECRILNWRALACGFPCG